MTTATTPKGLLLGALTGLATGEVNRRMSQHARVRAAGAGLVTAAAIYPLARRSAATGGIPVEMATIAGAGLLVGIAEHLELPMARALIAAGWAAHAFFDLLRGATPDSRLPDWYAPACASFDVVYALEILRQAA